MSRGFPSMTALLGLLAVAGYQNRDKIAEMLRGASSSNPGTGAAAPGPLGGLLAALVAGVSEGYSAADWPNSSTVSSRLARARSPSPGSARGQTSRSHRISLSRQSRPTCWQHWLSKRVFHEKKFCPGSHGTCRKL